MHSPGWTRRWGLRPCSLQMATAAGAGGKTLSAEMSKPSRCSRAAMSALDIWVSLVQNLTAIPASFSLARLGYKERAKFS